MGGLEFGPCPECAREFTEADIAADVRERTEFLEKSRKRRSFELVWVLSFAVLWLIHPAMYTNPAKYIMGVGGLVMMFGGLWPIAGARAGKGERWRSIRTTVYLHIMWLMTIPPMIGVIINWGVWAYHVLGWQWLYSMLIPGVLCGVASLIAPYHLYKWLKKEGKPWSDKGVQVVQLNDGTMDDWGWILGVCGFLTLFVYTTSNHLLP